MLTDGAAVGADSWGHSRLRAPDAPVVTLPCNAIRGSPVPISPNEPSPHLPYRIGEARERLMRPRQPGGKPGGPGEEASHRPNSSEGNPAVKAAPSPRASSRWSRRLARFVLRRSSFALAGNRLRPFPSAPPRTVLATFAAHGSPVAGFSGVRSGVLPSWVDTTIAEPHPRHLAYLVPYRSGPPAPLRPVAGSPGLRLL